MTNLSTEDRIMNGFLRVILDLELDATERQAAATAIRSGHVTNCLLSVLEFADVKRIEASESKPRSVSVADIRVKSEKKKIDAKKTLLSATELFTLVRKKKVSKIALLEVVERLNGGPIPDIDDETSMRDILKAFSDVSSDAEWITLTRAISGEIQNDSYLSRILGR